MKPQHKSKKMLNRVGASVHPCLRSFFISQASDKFDPTLTSSFHGLMDRLNDVEHCCRYTTLLQHFPHGLSRHRVSGLQNEQKGSPMFNILLHQLPCHTDYTYTFSPLLKPHSGSVCSVMECSHSCMVLVHKHFPRLIPHQLSQSWGYPFFGIGISTASF